MIWAENIFKTRPVTRKIDFVVAGTQKGGTTALDYYLRRHPEIAMAEVKEAHFFDADHLFDGKTDYSKYHSLFDFSQDGKKRGEVTPISMYWYSAPRRMWEYNPELRIILLLRNPIERAFSHWNMERDRKLETLSFREAITTEKNRCREALPSQHRVYSYVDRGFYSEQLRRLWHFFPREQTLILKSEDLKHRHQATMNKVFDYLGVEPLRDIESKELHCRPYQAVMTAEERDYLRETFRLEIRELEKLLGWDCSDWLV